LQYPLDQKEKYPYDAFLDLVGWNVARVLQMVDPAIRQIVKRMLALPILTIGSCSGHPENEEGVCRNPSMEVIFTSAVFGRQFITALKNIFSDKELAKFHAGGGCISPMMGTDLSIRPPLHIALKCRTPVSLVWNPKDFSAITLQEIWMRVSKAIDTFDHQGVFTPEIVAFQESAPYFYDEEWIEELERLP